MTIEVIFFDFDGTIADTLNTIVNITNRLAIQLNYKPITREEITQLKNLSSRQIIKKSGISILKFPWLISKVKSELARDIKSVKTFPEITETLIELRKHVPYLGILSSNSQENILAFLENNNLQTLFDFIYTEAPIFSKSRAINKILKQKNFRPEAIIYVGDETRDIEAAKRSRIKAIAVSWGFNSKEILAEQNPDFLIHQPRDLVEVIKRLQLKTI